MPGASVKEIAFCATDDTKAKILEIQPLLIGNNAEEKQSLRKIGVGAVGDAAYCSRWTLYTETNIEDRVRILTLGAELERGVSFTILTE